MFRKAVKIRLALFLVIAVVGIGYTGSRYVGLGKLLGGDGYGVTIDMAESGGLFANSEVSYRGVAVGRVQALKLTPSGIEAELHIDDTAPPIPARTRAVVANRSAVGEQYVDLRPDRDAGPYLADGSVIPRNRTELPPAPQTLLVNLDRLVTSVPTDSLRTVVDELGMAFNGTGDDLQKVLDNAGPFIAAADQHLPQTTGLLANGNTVLRTQQHQTDQINAFSSNLRGIADQLKRSDGDLRGVVQSAPGAAGELDALMRSASTDLGVVTANLLTTSQILQVRQPGIEEMLVALPVISSFTHTLSPDGTGHLGVVLNSFNPPACVNGYEGTPRRPGSDTSPAPTNMDLHCAEPPGSPTGVRGSQNVPRAPIPTPALPPPPLPFVNGG